MQTKGWELRDELLADQVRVNQAQVKLDSRISERTFTLEKLAAVIAWLDEHANSEEHSYAEEMGLIQVAEPVTT